jgi:hypothetical protein
MERQIVAGENNIFANLVEEVKMYCIGHTKVYLQHLTWMFEFLHRGFMYVVENSLDQY